MTPGKTTYVLSPFGVLAYCKSLDLSSKHTSKIRRLLLSVNGFESVAPPT